MGFFGRKSHRYAPLSTQMEGVSDDSPSRDLEHETRRSRIRRLFSCRSNRRRNEESAPSHNNLQGGPPEGRDDPPPLYFILSEVGSAEMNNPSVAAVENNKEQERQVGPLKGRIPRPLHILPSLANCFKDSQRDEDTLSLGKENITFEEGESRVAPPSDTSSTFEISSHSAFSPVMNPGSKYGYPIQARRQDTSHPDHPWEVGGNVSFSEEEVSSFTDSSSSFTDSSHFKGAQLILRAFSDDSDASDSLLGVTFPHPAGNEETLILDDFRLGIQTGHPIWSKKEKKKDIWREVDAQHMDASAAVPMPKPPSPIVVETSINDDGGIFWDGDDNDDDDWDCKDNGRNPSSFMPNDDHKSNHVFMPRGASVREDRRDDTSSKHSLSEQKESNPKVGKKEEQKSSSLPGRWAKNVLGPMCEFAREISSCGRVDDAGFFTDAPFDEIALDRERNTIHAKLKSFATPDWGSMIWNKPSEEDDLRVGWMTSCGTPPDPFTRRNGATRGFEQWTIPTNA